MEPSFNSYQDFKNEVDSLECDYVFIEEKNISKEEVLELIKDYHVFIGSSNPDDWIFRIQLTENGLSEISKNWKEVLS